MDSVEEEEFGQIVVLTKRIRSVLRGYPEGTSVLKELLQNADDAQATELKLCLDLNAYSTQDLLHPKAQGFQGPALLAYNDAVFSDQDFESIQRIGDSKKQGQRHKVGRFGVGFNAVYHLTDVPSFVSRGSLAIFDPHMRHLGDGKTGAKIPFTERKWHSQVKKHAATFAPYQVFGCKIPSEYKGTLFRLPLRTSAQAKSSEISKSSHTPNDVIGLLAEFQKECTQALLFLRFIAKVKVYIRPAGSSGPQLWYSCEVDQALKLASFRQMMSRLPALPDIASHMERSQDQPSQQAEVTVLSRRNSLVNDNTAVDESSPEQFASKWLIVQGVSVGKSLAFARDPTATAQDLNLVPFAGVAFQLSERGEPVVIDGLAYVFLPLPMATKLPFHVNGFFEIGESRRSLWFGSGMTGGAKLRADWNISLLQDPLPQLLHQALDYLRGTRPNLLSQPDLWYALWPGFDGPEPWPHLISAFYEAIVKQPMLPCGSSWVAPVDALCFEPATPREALVGRVLRRLGLKVVTLPSHVMRGLRSALPGIATLEPRLARAALRDSESKVNLKSDEAIALLAYLLSDGTSLQALEGLPLLPTMAETCVPIGAGQASVYMLSEQGLSLFSNVVPEVCMHEEIHQEEGLKVLLSMEDLIEHTNLKLATTTSLPLLLNQVKESSKGFPAIPEWLIQFWLWLADEVPQLKAQELRDLPVILCADDSIAKSDRAVSVLASAADLPPEVQDILPQLGVQVLHPSYSELSGRAFKVVECLVLSGTVKGLIAALMTRQTVEPTLWNGLAVNDAKALRQCFAAFVTQHSFDAAEAAAVQAMGIFPTLQGTLVDLISESRRVLPADLDVEMLHILCPDSSFLVTDDDVQRLSPYLRLLEVSATTVLLTQVLPILSTEKAAQPAYSALVERVLRDDPSDALAEACFVPTDDGELFSPSQLYHPDVTEARTITGDFSCYPQTALRTSANLKRLVALGLQEKVTPDSLLVSIDRVVLEFQIAPQNASERACSILAYIDRNYDDLFVSQGRGLLHWVKKSLSKKMTQEEFATALRNKVWLPSLTNDELPWLLPTDQLYAAKDIRLRSDVWLVGSATPVLAIALHNQNLKAALGLQRSPTKPSLIAHLLALAQYCKSLDADLQSSLVLALNRELRRVYQLLADSTHSEECQALKQLVNSQAWIWAHNRFCRSDELVFQCFVDLSPFLCVLPTAMAHDHGAFFSKMGVEKQCTFDQLVAFLQHSFQQQTESAGPSTISLDAVVAVAQQLGEHHKQDLATCTSEIYLPDSNGNLCPTLELVYNDTAWGVPEDVKLIHPSVSNATAAAMRANSLTRTVLDPTGLDNDIYESYGQVESLTNRLKGLLEVYPDGPSIMKELAQNADDAGASKLVITYSEMAFGKQSVFGPELADWQGPAIYVYNDSQFRDKDFSNLSKLAQSNKLDDPSSTGRFGLGFNSCYHWTDLPQIMSGEFLAFLDPHISNIPAGASRSKPGLRVRLGDLAAKFRDQFAPFCKRFGSGDCTTPFDGTLFRFALRDTVTAARSEIKPGRAYSREHVATLFESFRDQAQDVLLFLTNLKSIEVNYEDQEGTTHSLYKVTSLNYGSISDVLPSECSWFDLKMAARQQELDHAQFLTKLQAECVGRFESSLIALQLDEIQVLTTTELLTPDEARSNTEHWVQVGTVGSGEALAMATSPDCAELRLMPWGSVAIRVVATDSGFDIDQGILQQSFGRVYTWLPLPIQSPLPFTVNGGFEISSNRRDLWSGNDMTGDGQQRSAWNEVMMRDVIIAAFTRLLLLIKQILANGAGEHIKSILTGFSSDWPEPWTALIEPMVKMLVNEALLEAVVNVDGQHQPKWCTIEDCHLLSMGDESFSTRLLEVAKTLQIPVVVLSQPMVDLLASIESDARVLSPATLRDLLRSWSHAEAAAKLSDIRFGLAQLCRVCTHDIREEDDLENLLGCWILVTADGSVHQLLAGVEEADKLLLAVSDEYNCFSHLNPGRLLRAVFGHKIEIMLSKSSFNVAQLGSSHYGRLLEPLLEPKYTRTPVGQLRIGRECCSVWLLKFWNCCKRVKEFDVSSILKFPLLATSAEEPLIKLDQTNSNIVSMSGLSPSHVRLLERFGCKRPHSSCQMIPGVLVDLIPALHNGAAADQVTKAIYCSQAMPWGSVLIQQRSDAVAISQQITSCWRKANITPSEQRQLVEYLSSLPPVNDPPRAIRQACQLLPLFEVGAAGSGRFVSAAAAEQQLYQPPEQYRHHSELLTDSDLVANSETCGAWYDLAGISTMPLPQFVSQKVLPMLAKTAEDKRRLLSGTFVQTLPTLLTQAPFLREVLADSDCVLTEADTLAKPKDLFHPDAAIVRSLLGARAFPNPALTSSSNLTQLEQLGLQKQISYKVLLLLKADSMTEEQSLALFEFINDSALEIFETAQHAGQLEAVIAVLKTLPFIPFIPELAESNLDWPQFPWRTAGDVPAFVTSDDSRPRSDLLVCSGTHFIAKRAVSQEFKLLVGWNKQPQPSRVIAQLKLLRTAWARLQPDDIEPAAHCVSAAFGDIAHQLSIVSEADAPSSIDQLSNREAWIWTGTGFVAAARIVVEPRSDVSLRPFIWNVDEVSEQTNASKPVLIKLLERLNTHRQFGLDHAIAGLDAAHLACKAGESDQHFEQMIQSAKLVLPENSERQTDGEDPFCVPEPYQQAAALLTVHFFEQASVRDLEAGVPVLSSTNRLVSAKLVIFDDLDEQTRGSASYVFLHRCVSRELSQRLNVPSLTEFLTSNTSQAVSVACPAASDLMELQKDTAIATGSSASHPFFLHCVEAGDIFGATGVTVTLDTTNYPTAQLMQRSYDALQGPALCVTLHDICLNPEQLAQLLSPAGSPNAHIINGRRLNGQGLALSFDFAVAVACISGSTLSLFDPTGLYVARSSEAVPTAGAGQTFNFGKTPILVTHFQDQFKPFYAHGLKPPQGTTPAFSKDTIIRIPFRAAAPAPWLEGDAVSPNIESVLALLKPAARVWSHALMVSCELRLLRMCFLDQDRLQTAFQATIEVAPPTKQARQQLARMDDYGGVSGWLTKSYPPVSLSYTLTAMVKMWNDPVREGVAAEATLESESSQPSREELWYVVQQLGNAKARSIAADSFGSTRLCPRVCASVRLTKDGQLVTPGTGSCFGAGCEFEAPLPVSLHATLFPFGTSTSHPAVRTNFPLCAEFNQAQMVSLASAYSTLLELLTKTDPIAANPILLYQWFWPQPDDFQPASFKSYLQEFYSELLKLLLKGEFFRMDGTLAKMKDGMVLARDTPPELRTFMARKFPDCLQLPVEQVKQLRSADTENSFFRRGIQVSELGAKEVRQHLLKQAERTSDLFPAATEAESQQLAGQSLAFLLTDSKGPDAARGLALLPLVSGRTVAVGANPVVAATEIERRLLRGNDANLIAVPAAQALLASSITDAQLHSVKIARFRLARLALALPHIVPPSWENQRQVSWTSDVMVSSASAKAAEASGQESTASISAEWLNELFEYLSQSPAPEDGTQLVDSRCEDLDKWPLIPIQTQMLLTMRARKTVMHGGVLDSEDVTVVAMARTLIQMGIPVVDPAWSAATAALTGQQPPLPSASDGGLSYFLAKIRATSDVDHWQSSSNGDAAFDAAGALLQLLSTWAASLDDDDALRQALLKVPMFLTADRMLRVPFADVKAIDTATAATTQVDNPRQFVLIEPDTSGLFRYLRVEPEDRSSLLRDHIIPRLPSMSPEERSEALATLAPDWRSHRGTLSDLASVLQDLPCLQACTGDYMVARELVDERGCRLFGHVYKHRPDCRISSQYDYDTWKPLLQDLGVGLEMTGPRFIEGAQLLCHEWETRGEGVEIADDLSFTAERLVDHLIGNVPNLTHDDQDFLQRVLPLPIVPVTNPITRETTLTTFNMCSLPVDLPLVCLSKAIIKEHLEPPSMYLARFGIQSPPVVDDVIANLKMMPGFLARWPFPEMTCLDVIQATFHYFDQRWESMSLEQQNTLCHVPIVLVGSQLLSPSNVFFHLRRNLAPYIYEIPRLYSEHDGLLRKLGVKDRPNVDDFLTIMTKIVTDSGGKRLTPSQLNGIVQLLISMQALEANVLQRAKARLYVPDIQSRLVPASSAVFCDQVNLLQYVDVSKVNLYLVSHLLDASLCKALHLTALSDAVSQALATPPTPSECDAPNELPETTWDAVGRVLSSRCLGVVASETVAALSRLRSCTIQYTNEIKVAFTHTHSRLDVTRSEAACLHFYQQHKNVLWVCLQGRGLTTFEVLSKAISELLLPGQDLNLAPLLRCDVDSLEQVATATGLYHQEMAGLGRGIPGHPVLPEDKALLNVNPTRTKNEGEIVGVRNDQNIMVYAQVCPNDNSSTDEDSLVQQVTVSLGNGITRVVIPSRVYDFDPDREQAPAALAVPQHAGDASPGLNAAVDLEAAPARGDRQSTLVATIRDLMEQANLPFSAEQAQIMDEVVQLRTDNARLQTEIAENDSETELLRKRLEDFDVETTCSVCYQGALDSDVVVDTVCLPCGHMYCDTCAHRLNECAKCKRPIESRHRTFK
eukprot:m.291475 g.291475  ORF g.291475 m.291475 type:complete len:4534 (-) comp17817_c0_seq1:55-13656(-)